MKRRFLLVLLSVCVLAACLMTGCAKNVAMTRVSYYDESTYGDGATLSDINENLFYRNELVVGKTVRGADPAVMRITDPADPECGKFVLTVTAGSYGFQCWLSSDLVNWEPRGMILQADDDNTSDISRILYADTWASEMVWDEESGKYYLFFSATPRNDPAVTGYANDTGSRTNRVFKTEYSYIPYVAVSDSWSGPFTLIDRSESYHYPDGTPMTEEKAAADTPENRFGITDNAQGYAYFLKYSLYDPEKIWAAIENSDDSYVKEIASYEPTKLLRSIDYHPFVDDDGTKYLYLNVTKDNEFSDNNSTYVAVIRMNSWTDPDYTSFTTLTRYGQYELGGSETPTYENRDATVNEGAWMTKHNGKYYLTLSINGYATSYYKVIQAVSDSPMGPFRKLTEDEGGVVLASDAVQDVGGPGHHSIVEVDGEMYIVYHKVDDYRNPTAARHVAMNRLSWVSIKDKDGRDLDVMYAAGPTTTAVTPLPSFASGYENVAGLATVSATNLAEGSSADVLTDGLIPMRTGVNNGFMTQYVREASFTGETTVTLTFDRDVDVRAIMIYNAMDIRQAFYEVERIVFTCRENGNDTYRVIEHLGFDWRALSNGYDAEFSPTGNSLKTGGAAIAEFDTLTVREITITLKPATEEQIDWHDTEAAVQLAIAEIVVLGKKQ